MIELHYWPTPNGHKITMFLEEAGLPYEIVPVNIGRGEQFRPEFLEDRAQQPHAGDRRPRAGRRRRADLASSSRARSCSTWPRRPGASSRRTCAAGSRCCSGCSGRWAASGPMAGQNHHFSQYAPEKLPYAIDRYVNETNRLYGVLDKRLADRRVRGRRRYSIADMASYPWIVPYERQGQKLEDFPNLKRWFEADRATGRRRCAPTRPASATGGATRPSTRSRARSCSGRPRPACGAAERRLLGGRAPDRLYPIDELGLWRLT